MTNKISAKWAVFVIPDTDNSEMADYEEYSSEDDADKAYMKFDEDVLNGYYEDYDSIQIFKVRLLKTKEIGIPKIDEVIYDDHY
jgi:hypothetical protein